LDANLVADLGFVLLVMDVELLGALDRLAVTGWLTRSFTATTNVEFILSETTMPSRTLRGSPWLFRLFRSSQS